MFDNQNFHVSHTSLHLAATEAIDAGVVTVPAQRDQDWSCARSTYTNSSSLQTEHKHVTAYCTARCPSLLYCKGIKLSTSDASKLIFQVHNN